MMDGTEPQSHDAAQGHAARPVAGDDDVRRRAYELFEARRGADGDDVADWLAAERELAAWRITRPDDLGEPPREPYEEAR